MPSVANHHILTICLALMSLQGIICQELAFDKFTAFQHQDIGRANWSAAGQVRLTDEDLILFDPQLTVQMVTDVCSVNLSSCVPPGQVPPTSTPCYCTQVTDQEYGLYLSSPDDLSLTYPTVQAIVPSRPLFSPLSLAVKVGSLPAVESEVTSSNVCCDRAETCEQSLDIERRALERMMMELKESDDLKSRLANLEAELRKANEMKSQLSRNLEAELKKTSEMKSKLTTMEEELKKANEMNSELTTIKAELKNAHSQLATQNNTIRSLTNTISELSKGNKNHEEMTSQILTLVSKVANDSDQITEIHEVVTAPDTCYDVFGPGPRPLVTLANGMEVMCDTSTDDGGWVIIQRRMSSDTDFFRGWESYKYGFGDMRTNFWLGLEKVHRLTAKQRYELRIDMTFGGKNYFAKYEKFAIRGEQEKYKLLVTGYSGTAGDSLTGHSEDHNGMSFTTKDMDNDDDSSKNCASYYTGAWWYRSCHWANLNGVWGADHNKGMRWSTLSGVKSVSSSEMKIRPVHY